MNLESSESKDSVISDHKLEQLLIEKDAKIEELLAELRLER